MVEASNSFSQKLPPVLSLALCYQNQHKAVCTCKVIWVSPWIQSQLPNSALCLYNLCQSGKTLSYSTGDSLCLVCTQITFHGSGSIPQKLFETWPQQALSPGKSSRQQHIKTYISLLQSWVYRWGNSLVSSYSSSNS